MLSDSRLYLPHAPRRIQLRLMCLFVIYNSVDCGDYVVVSNASKIAVTGRKEDQLVYRKHSMFPGGLKETPYKVMKERKPDEVRLVFQFVYLHRLLSVYFLRSPFVVSLHNLSPRLSATLSPACCPRTSCASAG